MAIEQRIVAWEKEDEGAQALANGTDAPVCTMLGHMAEEMQLYERGALKAFLTSILEQIELDPDRSTLQLSYRIVWRPQRDSNSRRRRERAMS